MSFSEIRSLLATRVPKLKRNMCLKQSNEPEPLGDDPDDSEESVTEIANEEVNLPVPIITIDHCYYRMKFTPRDPYKRARQNRSLAPMTSRFRKPLIRDDADPDYVASSEEEEEEINCCEEHRQKQKTRLLSLENKAEQTRSKSNKKRPREEKFRNVLFPDATEPEANSSCSVSDDEFAFPSSDDSSGEESDSNDKALHHHPHNVNSTLLAEQLVQKK
jgi:hypothetical protein